METLSRGELPLPVLQRQDADGSRREQRRSKYYAFIEQFDWNGNPVRRYRIDNWGYFAVDESRKALYVISTTDEFPFVKYELQ